MSQADVKNRSKNGETMPEEPKPAQPGASRDDAARDSRVEGEQPETPSQGGTPERGNDSAREPAGPVPAPAGESGAEGGVDVDERSLAEELEAVRAELAEHKDRYLRAVAEAENIRRRADTDVSNARKYAIEGFASEVLAVRDSLEIARSLDISEDDAGAVAKMKEGLDLTLKQMDSALAKFSIEVIDPQKGDKLDPERHQAMTTQESDNVPPNHILAVIQKGYTIHDRLLRPAMVVVARKRQDAAQTESETA